MAQLWPKRNLLGEATRPQSCIPIHIHWRRAPALTPLHSPNTWAQFTKCCCENSINILRPSCGKPKILYVELLGPGYVASAFIVALTGRHSIVSFVCAYLPEPSIRGPPHTHTQREKTMETSRTGHGIIRCIAAVNTMLISRGPARSHSHTTRK